MTSVSLSSFTCLVTPVEFYRLLTNYIARFWGQIRQNHRNLNIADFSQINGQYHGNKLNIETACLAGCRVSMTKISVKLPLFDLFNDFWNKRGVEKYTLWILKVLTNKADMLTILAYFSDLESGKLAHNPVGFRCLSGKEGVAFIGCCKCNMVCLCWSGV